MNTPECQFCGVPLENGGNCCPKCFRCLDMETGLPNPPRERDDDDDPYPDRVMVDAEGRPFYEP